MAIFDTGCDHAAPGLIKTSEGIPKFLDFVDTTGSGDVDMTVTAKLDPETSSIRGLSGRLVKLGTGAGWENPTGVYQVGLKMAYEVFPKPLTKRIKGSRHAVFELNHRRTESALLTAIAILSGEGGKNKDNKDDVVADENEVQKYLKRDKSSLEAELAERQKLWADFAKNDVGPVVDCISWHNGTSWVAVIDTEEKGDVSDKTPMAAYRECFRYAVWSEETKLNYSFNFYDEGKTLSIVVSAGSHGTHVAGIVGAYFPEDP